MAPSDPQSTRSGPESACATTATGARSSSSPRSRVAAFAGTILSGLSRALGRGSGSVVGGHAILALEPRALEIFSAGRQVVLVSGTNGKTTTTKLLAKALGAASRQFVVTNLTGANLPTGLVTALAGARTRPGAPAVLEVDEAWLARVAGQVRPAVLVLLNLSRDQLDRNNEVRQVARRWRQACSELSPQAAVIANADDPLVVFAAIAAPKGRVTWVAAGLGWRGDASGCPQCAGAIIFEPDRPDWHCSSCDFARPEPEARLGPGALTGPEDGGTVTGHVVATLQGCSLPLRLSLPGRCNQANALSAIAAIQALGYAGAELEAAVGAMREVSEVSGRYSTVRHAGVEARLLLAKNPAGWAEVFDMLSPAPAPVAVAINARIADGHDPSWLWDVPFECLGGRHVVASGERCLDLAVRLEYAGVEHVVEADLVEAVLAAGRASRGRVDVVANYTAFHQLLARWPGS